MPLRLRPFVAFLFTSVCLAMAACSSPPRMTPPAAAKTPQEAGLDFWQEFPKAQVQQLGEPRFDPAAYRVLLLDLAGLRRALAALPADGAPGTLITLPLPDGTQQPFRMRPTTVMAPELAARYPELRTYAGEVPTHPENRVRLELTPSGLHALLVHEGRSLLIEPYRTADTEHYICFDKASLPLGSKRSFNEPSPEGN